MKCPKCGFVSYNHLDSCKRCGTNLAAYKRRIGIAEDAGSQNRPVSDQAKDVSILSPAVESAAAAEFQRTLAEPEISQRLNAEQNQRVEREAHAEADRIRLAAETAARENAERTRHEAEQAAREEAERIRLSAETAARENAERLRKQAEEDIQKMREQAKREAEELRLRAQQEVEQEARERAETLRRQAELDIEQLRQQAQAEAEKLRLAAQQKAEEEVRSERERLRREAEREALLEKERLRLQAEREAEERRTLLEKKLAEESARDAKGVQKTPPEDLLDLIKAPELSPVAKEIVSEAEQASDVQPKAEGPPAVKPPEKQRRYADWQERIEDAKPSNVPGAQDYLEYLARKRDRAPQPEPEQSQVEAGRFDFPPNEEIDAESSDAAPAAENAVPTSDAAADQADDDEILEEIIEEEVVKGGLFMRLLGAGIDTIILALIIALFLLLGKGVLTIGGGSFAWTSFLKISGPIYILFLLIAASYFTLFVGGSGQTPGMMVLGLKVVNKRGESIGYALAFFRHVSAMFSILVLGMGIWWIPLDFNKQGWHDKLTQSVVIRV